MLDPIAWWSRRNIDTSGNARSEPCEERLKRDSPTDRLDMLMLRLKLALEAIVKPSKGFEGARGIYGFLLKRVQANGSDGSEATSQQMTNGCHNWRIAGRETDWRDDGLPSPPCTIRCPWCFFMTGNLSTFILDSFVCYVIKALVGLLWR